MIPSKTITSRNKILLITCLATAFLIPRLSNIRRYVTVDEAKWVMRSGNFLYALATKDFAHTYQREHPGVTIMWAGTAAYLLQFPDYVRFGPGNFTRPQLFSDYLQQHKQEPLEILALARVFMVFACGAALLLIWFCMVPIVGWLPATLGYLLIAFDPFYTGLSRLLHLDALSSTLMLLSFTAWLAYNKHDRNWLYLFLSGVAAGLSWLTKSPAFVLIPMIGLIELGSLWKNRRSLRTMGFNGLWRTTLPLLYWILIGAGVFIALWPAMWVEPISTLQQIFAQATSYAVEGHESATYFMGKIYDHETPIWYFYPVNILWRATPIVLLGLLLASIAVIFQRKLDYPKEWNRWMLVLILFAGFFLLFMSQGAKKFDRYIVPVFLSLDLIAGFGWGILLQALSKRIPLIAKTSWQQYAPAFVLGVAVIGYQAAGTLRTAPYYLTYYNPWIGGQARAPQALMIGWGEGIDQAARYLNTLPEAYKMHVASWYGEASFGYLFEGKMREIDEDTTLEDLTGLDYAVIYIHQWQRQLPSPAFLERFASATPEYTVRIGNLDYANVYNLHQSPLLSP
jgi:hypothetical protein